MSARVKLAISACLLGQPVRYDGQSKIAAPALLEQLRTRCELLPICPELLGGLPVPRPAAELVGGEGADALAGRARLLTRAGEDVTHHFIEGAQRALALCARHEVRCVLLKARSPSCGHGEVYDGSFSGALRAGDGVTAALLRAHGILVFDEAQGDALLAALDELAE